MCDPLTMMAVSTGVGVLGTVQGAQAGAASARYQQQIAQDNAARTTEQMRDAAVRGADEEQRVLRDGAGAVAGTRGAFAANNMDLSFGSPLDTIMNTYVDVRRDADRVRVNTGREVDDLTQQRTNYLNSASVSGAEASNATSSGFVAGVGTALGGASSAYQYRASIS